MKYIKYLVLLSMCGAGFVPKPKNRSAQELQDAQYREVQSSLGYEYPIPVSITEELPLVYPCTVEIYKDSRIAFFLQGSSVTLEAFMKVCDVRVVEK